MSLLGSPASEPRPLLFLPCALPPLSSAAPPSAREKAAASLLSKLALRVGFRGERALRPVTGFLIIVQATVSPRYQVTWPRGRLGNQGPPQGTEEIVLQPHTGSHLLHRHQFPSGRFHAPVSLATGKGSKAARWLVGDARREPPNDEQERPGNELGWKAA